MPVADFAQNVQSPFFSMNGRTALPPPAPATTADSKVATSSTDPSAASGKSFLDNLLDIVNPLQHIPIVSTIYSALTGDKAGPFEQIAGDTLYGGVTGLATSIAGEAFTQVTGKSVGDTVLSLFQNDNSTKVADAATYLVQPANAQTEVAAAAPTGLVPYSSYSSVAAVAAAAPASPDNAALTASLQRNNVDADLALRASYAYRHAVAQLDTP